MKTVKAIKLQTWSSLFLVGFCLLMSTAMSAQLTEYYIEVKTADVRLAGSDNGVEITLKGDKGSTEPFFLSGLKRRDGVRAFQYTKKDIGNIRSIILDLSYKLADPWECEYIKITKGDNVKATNSNASGGYFEFEVNTKLYKSAKEFRPNSNSRDEVIPEEVITVNTSGISQTDSRETETLIHFYNNLSEESQSAFKETMTFEVSESIGISTSDQEGVNVYAELSYESPPSVAGTFGGKVGAAWDKLWSTTRTETKSEVSISSSDLSYEVSPGTAVFMKVIMTKPYIYQKYTDNKGNNRVIRKVGNLQMTGGGAIPLPIPTIDRTTGAVIPQKWEDIEQNWIPLLHPQVVTEMILPYKDAWIAKGWVTVGNTLSENDVVQAHGSHAVYIIKNGVRRWIPDVVTLNSLGFGWSAVRKISSEVMNSVPQGPQIPSRKEGKLYKGSSHAVYMIKGGKRCWAKTAAVFNHQWNKVKVIPNSDLFEIPEGEALN